MVNNNSDFSEDIVTPWRWSKTETCRSFLDDFLINFNLWRWSCARVGIDNWVILLRARYKYNKGQCLFGQKKKVLRNHHHQFYMNCRDQLKCDSTSAETRIRLSAKRTSPFKSAGASVQSITGSRGVRHLAVVMLDTPCSEVVWRALATHSIRQFPLQFPSRASPCAITSQLESNCCHVEYFTSFSLYGAAYDRRKPCPTCLFGQKKKRYFEIINTTTTNFAPNVQAGWNVMAHAYYGAARFCGHACIVIIRNPRTSWDRNFDITISLNMLAVNLNR